MTLLEGKVAVVTGGSNGIGRAVAVGFARHGARAVVVADLDLEPRDGAGSTCDVIATETACVAQFVRCDVRNPDEVERVVEAAERYGPLDIIANIAGVAAPGGSLLEMPDEAIDVILDVNVKGTMYGCRAAARVMQPRGRGCLINMSSIVGLRGGAGNAAYVASKGAVRLLSYGLAAQLGPHGIRVNVLHPGVIATDMSRAAGATGPDSAFLEAIPSRRIGEPHDVAGAAVFLASDLASYVNGVSLPVDGGLASAL